MNHLLMRARLNRGLSRAMLADITGVSVKQLGSYERGEASPRPEAAKRIADYFEVPATVLFPPDGLGALTDFGSGL